MYLRGQSLGRSRCVPHTDGQPAAGRSRRRSWAGLKDLKAVSPQTERKGTHLTILAQQDFLSKTAFLSRKKNLFLVASPCGISQRHDASPAASWQRALGTERSPHGCLWQGRGRGLCAVWSAPSVLGYCRKTQMVIILLHHYYFYSSVKHIQIINPNGSWCGKKWDPKSDLPVPIRRFWWFLES